MKRILFAVFILLSTHITVFAQSTITHSVISFKIKNLGITTNGTISGLQATAHFDPQNPGTAKIDASVDVNTINTDNSLRDSHLKDEDYFDVAQFPKITLKSVSIKNDGGDKYKGQFNLTIKNKTLPVTIPFTAIKKGDVTVFNGTFTINRRDYDVGGATLTLSDNVIISIEAEIHD
jgi:polyisoprenoid-binding protein YceI